MKKYLTIKLAILLLTLTTSFGASSFALAAEKLILRNNIIVSTNVVRVGDLFKNAGKNYGVALYRAPSPGKEGVLNATRLNKRLARFNLEWENTSGLSEVIVRRSSQLVPFAEIESVLKNKIAEHIKDPTMAQDLEVRLSEKLDDFYIAQKATPHINVRHLNYNARTGRFNALLTVSEKNQTAKPISISGLAYEVTEVAVLSKDIERNDVISENDIDVIRVPIQQVNSRFAVRLQELAGYKAKKDLRANRPIRKTDIALPKLVSRGDLVTVLYEAGNLTITARGIAMENGTKGRSIRIKNPHSKRMLEAVVTGPGIVKTKPLVRNLAQIASK